MPHTNPHAASHVGTDAIQSATASVPGLATAAQIDKLDKIDAEADVTGSNPPQAHAASHQNAGGDDINVAGLSGVLADKQDASKLQGRTITTSVPSDNDVYGWNNGASEFQPRNQHNVPTKLIVCRTLTSAGINAAIDLLGISGGEVYLPEGTYVITASIVIDYNNTTLRGAGAGTILDASAGQTFDVITSAKDYTVIADLQVLGDAGGAQTKDLIVITGAYCTVRGCLLKESDHHGLLLSTNNHANVEGNIIEANDNAGISVATFDRIRIRGNQFIGGSVGIDLDSNSQLSLVANNAFTEVTWQSINDDGSSQVIIGNTFWRSGPVDIWSNTSVIGNHFHDGINDKNDLNLTGASHNAIVVGNFFYGAIGYSERAISVVSSDNVIIHSNYSYGHDTCGIAIDTNSNFVSLMGNMLRDTTPTVFAKTDQVAHIRSVVVGQQQSFLVAGVNLKSVAQTDLYTVPTGYRLLVDTAEVLIDTITGAAAMPTIRFGVDGDEGSFVGARALDATMNEVNARQSWDCPQDGLAAGQILEFGVTVAGTSTTQTASVMVTGRLLEA